MRSLLLAILMLVTSVTFSAAQGVGLIGLGGSDTVIVWRDKKAHDEGLSLISAGVHKSNPLLLIPLVACIVPSGTRAIITDGGFITHDVMIVEGENAGCRGN